MDHELEIVPEPLTNDVLFGRDKHMFNHHGNVKFRVAIQSRAKEYELAPSRRVKSSIVYSVVQSVHGYGGRFLKNEDGVWKVVGVTEAIQKVGHALRDKKQHNHKMKARQNRTSCNPATTQKSVAGGCELLLTLGQLCAEEMEGRPPTQPKQETKTSHPLGSMGTHKPSTRTLPLMLEKRNLTAHVAPAKKRRKSHPVEHRHEAPATTIDDENSAAKAILALGGLAPANNAPLTPAEVTSSLIAAFSARQELEQTSPRGSHARNPMGPPQPRAMPPPIRRPDPALYAVNQYSQQRRANSEPIGTHEQASMIPPPRNNTNQGGDDQHLRISSQANALIQAHQMKNLQMSSLMMGTTGTGPHMGGNRFGSTPVMPQNRMGGHQQLNADEWKPQPSSNTRPPVIYTDQCDNDGQWIFYPIKVPNIKLAGTGWKLALVPIDGKGLPIELDPKNIQFNEI